MSLWQLAKDKKRRVAQKLAERRASMKSTGEGEDPYDDPYYKPDAGLLEDRAAFKEYVKASKHMQKKVAALTSQVCSCCSCSVPELLFFFSHPTRYFRRFHLVHATRRVIMYVSPP